MSLPAKFSTPAVYFESCVDFLRTYAWVYQHANTCFLRSGVLEHMDASEQEYFINVTTDELNRFPIVDSEVSESESMPKSLQEFRARLKDLIPKAAFEEPTAVNLGAEHSFRKMSVKKQHEICRLAQVINDVCDRDEVLIDFGAGLGYLSERLYDKKDKDYLILGLEADAERVDAARKRLVENIPAAKDCIVYEEQMITESSASFIEESVQEMLSQRETWSRPGSSASWTIIGLHACADLTITSMRLFFAMPRVRRLIIMPCCYHKLQTSASSESPTSSSRTQPFVNFPLSRSLRQAVANDPQIGAYFNRPFLRLACQQTLARWSSCSAEQHFVHGMEMWQRSVVDAIVDEQETPVKRKGKIKGPVKQPLTFEALCETYELKSIECYLLPWRPEHERKFEEILRKYAAEGPRLAEGLTCLQTAMQKLCENIVLYDRSCYMEESAAAAGLELSVRHEKLMDEKLSPRCYVLIAEKLTWQPA